MTPIRFVLISVLFSLNSTAEAQAQAVISPGSGPVVKDLRYQRLRHCEWSSNLLVNGGAESGMLDGWGFPFGTWDIEDNFVFAGNHAFKIFGFFKKDQELIFDSLGVSGAILDEEPRIRYRTWAASDIGLATDHFEIEVQLLDEFFSPVAIFNYDSEVAGKPLTTEYERHQFHMQNYGPDVRYAYVSESGFALSGDYFFDNSALQVCIPTGNLREAPGPFLVP